MGEKSSYVVANVTEEESVQNAVDETVKKFGGIHIAVKCAGIGSASKTVGRDGAHPLDYFKTVVDINLNVPSFKSFSRQKRITVILY